MGIAKEKKNSSSEDRGDNIDLGNCERFPRMWTRYEFNKCITLV